MLVWVRCLLALMVVACLFRPDPAQASPRAEAGTLDLRTWSPAEDGLVDVSGSWTIHWGVLETREPTSPADTVPITVPGPWTDSQHDGQAIPPFGYGTYHLTVLLPEDAPPLAMNIPTVNTAFRMYVNGDPVGGAGHVATQQDEETPEYAPQQVMLPSHDSRLHLSIQVSNHHYRHGGLWLPLQIGPADQIIEYRQRQAALDLLLFAIISFVGLQQLVWFWSLPARQESLYFAAYCISVAIYTLFNNQYVFLQTAWAVPWELVIKITNGSFYLALPFSLTYLASIFPAEASQRLVQAVQGIGLAAFTLVLLTPATVHSQTVPAMLVLLVIIALYATAMILLALARRRRGSITVSGGLAVLVGCATNDVLLNFGVIESTYLTSLGTVAFIASQSIMLTRRHAWTYREVTRLSDNLRSSNAHLQATNQAVSRFVPTEFLKLLQRDSVRDIQRGDHRQMTMGVMFCDLRSFTTMIEGMSPKEAFAFINRYLLAMEPRIARNGGFINQYLGDCIMALFPDTADGSVQAGIEMSLALGRFNEGQRARGEPEIRIGIGINVGSIMMGTIGGQQRLDSGVIGDPVNLAARLEGMTKIYGCRMVVSESVVCALKRPEDVAIRELDCVLAKGKTHPIRLYEIIDALPDARRAAVQTMTDRFHEGLAAYRAGHMEDALQHFDACLRQVPEDPPSSLYVRRCRDHIQHGIPQPWTGVTLLTQK